MFFTDPLIASVLDLGSSEPRVRLKAAQQIAQRLQYPGFLETLRSHRLIPLLYQTLSQFTQEERGEVPLLKELRWEYLHNSVAYRNQVRETSLLLEGLADAGVEVILLKGIYIRHCFYDDPVCRPMLDLDVLISPADLERTRASLDRQGYTLMPRDLDLRPGYWAKFGWVLCYKSPQGNLPFVDVHWEIQEVGTFYRLPYSPLRARATPWELKGRQVLVLSPEHLIMHMCLHTFEELEKATLLKISDLDRALNALTLDWDLFLEDVSRFHIQGPVLCILREMARWRPGLVPDAVLNNLGAYHPSWAERFIIARQANAMLVSSIMTLWRHLPVKAWPEYLWGKLWPTQEYLEANARSFSSRMDYLSHILGRAQQKT